MFDSELLPLYGSMFNVNSRPDLDWNEANIEVTATLFEDKNHSELVVLEKKFGSLQDKSIEVNLSDLLEMLPRKRQRIDAYNSLVKHLKNTKNATLTIKSRKTK